MNDFIIEIATTDFYSTQAAVAGGANRVELCAALSEGGTTASYGMIKQCRESFEVQLFPIIRPRSGDFLYNEDEFQIIKRDALLCKQFGCDGVVIGFLEKDGNINKKWTAEIIELVYPLEVTFHRAFDRCKDPFRALEELIQLGCQRILTSGQEPDAIKGAQLIAQFIKAANDQIVIMPGSGVRKENIKELAEVTGAVEFHSSLRTKATSKMEYIHPSFATSEESYTNWSVNADEVRAMREALTVSGI